VVSVAVGVVLVLLLSGVLVGVTTSDLASRGEAVGITLETDVTSAGEIALAAAEASLAAGYGPAHGEPLACVNSTSNFGASCSSPVASSSALTITSFTVHPNPTTLAYPFTFQTKVTGGSPPYSYSYKGLPAPCSSANVSSFSCNAYYLGYYNVTVTVTDTAHANVSATVTAVDQCVDCLGGLTWGSATNPNARTQAAITDDLKDNYVVMFGGWNGSAIFGDTWYFKQNKWEPMDPLRAPSPRYDGSMAYDKKDGYVVLFGGRSATGVLGDTWTFLNNTWTEVATSVAPSPRAGAALAWDPKENCLVLFGGSNGSATFSDTWKFVGGNWTLLYPTAPKLSLNAPDATVAPAVGGYGEIPFEIGSEQPRGNLSTPALPPGRSDAAFTYDQKDGYPVLFGGVNETGGKTTFLNDTWAFESGKWVYLPEPFAPPARSQAVFAYDTIENYTVLFGGGNGSAPRDFQDTWEFAGGLWTELFPGFSPSPREGAGGVWDEADLKLMVFSGNEEGFPANIPDTWYYGPGNWSVDGSTPLFSWPGPSPRIEGGLAFDAAAGYSIFFGGETEIGVNGETWAYGNNQWIELFPAIAPPARAFAAMAYDAKDGIVVLFGGLGALGIPLGDTWTFNATPWNGLKAPTVGGNWTELSPATSPSARYGAGATYDSEDEVFLLFGGVGRGGSSLDDTWSFSGGIWTEVAASGSGSTPSARAFALLTDDPQDGYVVLFGGMSGATLFSDTWSYVKGVWTSLSPATHPSARWGSGFVYDPINSQVVLFGGCGQAVNPVLLQCDRLTNDTWRFIAGTWASLVRDPSPYPRAGAAVDFDNSPNDECVLITGGLVNRTGALLTVDRWNYAGVYTQWAEPTYPSAREGAASIYEIADQHIVMFGGYGPLPGGGDGYLNDTWEWDTYVWNEAASPGVTCKGCADHHPSPRAWGSLGWDPVSGQEIYFGGRNQTGYLGQTWAWSGSYTTGEWTELTPTKSPSARSNESMVWDENDGYLVLFGGQNASGALGDTWTFIGGEWTERTPAVSPAPRAGADMAYDTTTDYLILFGGWNPVTHLAYNDTWKYVGGFWTNITPASSPSPRYGATMSDDPQDGAVMFFGGVTPGGTYLGDTWYFKAGQWHEVDTKGNAPLPSAFGNMGNDESDGNVMFFGGYNGNYLSSFWVFF